MKILIAEDDITSAKILMKMLSGYGKCDLAVDGVEAVEAFEYALDSRQPYDLVCLDIMMPRMDGQEVLRNIRVIEGLRGITGLNGVKIMMTTALDDFRDIMKSFREQCESYLVKPIHRAKLADELAKLGFHPAKRPPRRTIARTETAQE